MRKEEKKSSPKEKKDCFAQIFVHSFHDYGRRRRTFVQSDEESDYYEPQLKESK